MSEGQFNNAMKGVLFDNDKAGAESRPDLSGNAQTDCAHCGKPSKYWLKGWRNFAKGDRRPFIKLAFEPQRPRPAAPRPDFDDDIPF